MAEEQSYEQLRDWLKKTWNALPETDELLPLIKATYIPEEASILINMPFSGRNLEEIQVQQTNFMVERLPWAQITGKSRIRPWPGFLTLQGQSFPAILVKSGTRILYPMKLREPVSLELLYGISPDAYNGGGENEFNFEVRQLEADGSVLAASRLSLHPGVKPEDRNWHPLKLSLKRTAGGILDFGFACGSIECPGTGAFAQAVLRPAEP